MFLYHATYRGRNALSNLRAKAEPPDIGFSIMLDEIYTTQHHEVPSSVDYLSYLNLLYSYALTLVQNGLEAEDLVHDTYVSALSAMTQPRLNSKVKISLVSLLRKLWLDKHNEQCAGDSSMIEIDRDRSEADTQIEDANYAEVHYVSTLAVDQVRKAIQKLSADFREMIFLREFADLSYMEIAKLLDCPIDTVLSRLARARSQLRELLSTHMQPLARK